MAKQKTDLVNGPIIKSIFSFCIPLVLGSLLQVFFNMADQIVLGQMAGSVALASVGACGNVVGILVNFFIGLSGGVGVVLARAIGREDDAASKRIIGTAFCASVIIGLSALCIALPAAAPLLKLTQCPEECFKGAITYTYIYSLGIPVITVYNFCATAIRVTGDSRRPTLYMVAGGALNVALNVTLCFIMQNKVAAVAIATVVSQGLSAFLTVRRLVIIKESYRLELRHPILDRSVFFKFLRYGIPSGFVSCLFNIANLQLQAGINSFGTDAIAGHSAACSVESLISPFVAGFAVTASTMVGQNLGAEKPDRVKKAIVYNEAFSVSVACVLCLIVWFIRIPLLKLYVPEAPDAIVFAETRMKCVLLWFGVNAASAVVSHTLNAYGYSIFVMISNILSTIVFRTFWMQLVFPRVGTFMVIMQCYTVSWWITLTCNAVFLCWVYSRYKKGRVRNL